MYFVNKVMLFSNVLYKDEMKSIRYFYSINTLYENIVSQDFCNCSDI